MAKRISFSFRDDEEELYEWVERQYEEGNFRTRSDVIIRALKLMRKTGTEDINKQEWKA